MKTKAIFVFIAFVSLSCLFLFKSLTSDSGSEIALMSYQIGKNNDDNFVITYAEGKIEKIPFTYHPTSKESRFEMQVKLTEIFNYMKKKGYRPLPNDGYYMLEKQ